MSSTSLLMERTEGVLVLTLNRPERRNALSPELYEALLDALRGAASDTDIGAVVLTGAGGAFCAGGDVSRMAAAAGAEDLPFEGRVARLRHRAQIGELLHGMPKPTLAMMRGPAVGAGLSLALACDMRLGDSTARLKTGFIDVAVPGDFGGHYFLPRIIGMAKARELYLTSPMLGAQEALGLGLLHRVVEPDALQAEAMALAMRWARGPRTALAHMKSNLNQALHASLGEVLDAEAWRHVRCTQTADHKEAARAFAEKRPPVFGGD